MQDNVAWWLLFLRYIIMSLSWWPSLLISHPMSQESVSTSQYFGPSALHHSLWRRAQHLLDVWVQPTQLYSWYDSDFATASDSVRGSFLSWSKQVMRFHWLKVFTVRRGCSTLLLPRWVGLNTFLYLKSWKNECIGFASWFCSWDLQGVELVNEQTHSLNDGQILDKRLVGYE